MLYNLLQITYSFSKCQPTVCVNDRVISPGAACRAAVCAWCQFPSRACRSWREPGCRKWRIRVYTRTMTWDVRSPFQKVLVCVCVFSCICQPQVKERYIIVSWKYHMGGIYCVNRLQIPSGCKDMTFMWLLTDGKLCFSTTLLQTLLQTSPSFLCRFFQVCHKSQPVIYPPTPSLESCMVLVNCTLQQDWVLPVWTPKHTLHHYYISSPSAVDSVSSLTLRVSLNHVTCTIYSLLHKQNVFVQMSNNCVLLL